MNRNSINIGKHGFPEGKSSVGNVTKQFENMLGNDLPKGAVIIYDCNYVCKSIDVPSYENTSIDVNGIQMRSDEHAWNFVIYGRYLKILIDVDDSLHDPNLYSFKNNEEKVLHDIMKFKDNLRKYQTDGLEAYTVRAYNNKLSDDNMVFSYTHKGYIYFKTLMDLIKSNYYTKEEITSFPNRIAARRSTTISRGSTLRA